MLIPRYRCNHCNRLHSALPDFIVPYKHYTSEIIEVAIEASQEDFFEDYPCEGTIKHWKWWFAVNRTGIEGQIKSASYRLLDKDEAFLKSRGSLLRERDRKAGWLSQVVRFIYNSGGRIPPKPEINFAPSFVC